MICRNFFYVGQSVNLKRRMYQHIYDIKTFSLFSTKNTSVSIHFNLLNHNHLKHFHFFVFRKDIENKDARLFTESFFIHLCKKLEVNIINDHIPIIKKYYNNIYQ